MSGGTEKNGELNAYLEGGTPLSRAYREGARELPPRHLDAQILAEAHRADARPDKNPARGPFSGGRWMVPASLAAVVVLAVSVVVLLPEGRPGYERQRDVTGDSVAPQAETPEAESPDESEAEQDPALEYAAPPAAARESDQAPSKASAPSTLRSAPPEQAPPDLELDSILTKELDPAAPASAAPPDADRASDPARERIRPQRGVATTGEEGAAGKTEAEAFEDAEAWLERIEILIERGRLDAARESLAKFRLAYPQTGIPPRISEALGSGGN